MKFTSTQLHWLQKLRASGGRARVDGLHVVVGGERSNTGAQVTFLHLVARGAVRGEGGELVITAYGHRVCAAEPPKDLKDPALDRDRLNFIETESCDVRCLETRQHDDADVFYHVVSFWQQEPHERIIGQGKNPREAIDDAIRIKRSVPDTCKEPLAHPEFCPCEIK